MKAVQQNYSNLVGDQLRKLQSVPKRRESHRSADESLRRRAGKRDPGPFSMLVRAGSD
ncbi:hypothetical protein [uncultured Sphingomonas sp.]|uniref:hypothetical protein n=1 Tax=uncultured Sphingomonas sp. TaxID=158754 RepID=UPI0025FB8546|nr:hypothetical protein [uncultured Sphingomonas sp.]